MELNVQKYLRSGHGPEDLKPTLGIGFKRHPKFPLLHQFKYSQIDSPKDDPIVQECRGIILDSEDNWNVVAYPFKRFYNFGEGCAASIDWSTAEIQDKLDGSLCILYHYKGEWNVATSGSPDAGGQVNDFGMTFAELFWNTFQDQGLKTKFYDDNKDYTFMFELCTPYNRVVVEYKGCSLHPLGLRNNKTFQEYKGGIKGMEAKAFPYPKTYPLNSLEACLEAAKHLNPLQNEGYVICDANFNRIKIKSPNYVALHHAKDTLSKKHMALIIRTGEYAEFKLALDSFPELRSIFDELFETYNSLTFNISMAYESIKGIVSQKAFAASACIYPYSDVLFSIRKRKESIRTILSKMSENRYLGLMGVK